MASNATRVLAALAVVLTVGGCANYSPRPAATPPARPVSEIAASALVAEWQRRVDEHVAQAGNGDPAVLAQLPSLRSSAVLRPAQVVFAATELESFAPERDGYDVFGLLVGKQQNTDGPRYVFIVGTVARQAYRSHAVVDIRLAAMTVRNGTAAWQTGTADNGAIDRYRAHADATRAVRFPADQDQFRLVDCPQGACVEERVSGARWSLYLGQPVAYAPAARPVD